MHPLHVVKIGGDIIDDRKVLDEFLSAFVSDISGPKILVHGGGKILNDLASRLNIPVKMIDGRRVTDRESLELAVMVYGGLINKSLVAALQAKNCPAMGLSGADGAAIVAEKRAISNIDYGLVGDIRKINNDLFGLLLNHGLTPVICALTADTDGQILNTNADTIAASLAVSLSKEFNPVLRYVMRLPGVLKDANDPGSLIRSLDHDMYLDLKTKNLISGGMIPKLDTGYFARSNGVERVYISDYRDLKNLDRGTILN